MPPPRPKLPVITIAKSKTKPEGLEGLERWKAKHPEVLKYLDPEHYLVDAMRGRSSAWYRIRVNLKNVPEDERPAETTPDPDYDPIREWKSAGG
jgi:bifunctional non-homologous end joining protein LigD